MVNYVGNLSHVVTLAIVGERSRQIGLTVDQFPAKRTWS